MVGSRALDDRVRLSHTSLVSVLTGRDFRIGSFFADLMVSTTRSVYPNEPFARRSRRNKAREDRVIQGEDVVFRRLRQEQCLQFFELVGLKGRKMTEQEVNLSLAQARALGEL